MMAAAKTTNERNLKTKLAKRAFLAGLFDLSWRLLGAMLVPLFAGLYIDSQRADDGQGFALGGFLVGIVLGVIVMRSVIKKMADRSV